LLSRLTIDLIQAGKEEGRGGNVWAGIIPPVLLIVIGCVKISLPYLLLGTALYICWRLNLLAQKTILFGSIASICAVVVCLKLFGSSGAGLAKLSLFNFDRLTPEWRPYFFVFYFLWIWTLLFLRIKQLNLRTVGEFLDALRTRRLFELEVAITAAVLGLIPYFLINIGPDWAYFTEFQIFLGIILVFSYVSEWRPWGRPFRSMNLWSVIGAVLGMFAIGHVVATTGMGLFKSLKVNATVRAELAGLPVDDWRSHLRELYRVRPMKLDPSISDKQKLENVLLGLEALPVREKRRSVLYIPKPNRVYWAGLQWTPEIPMPFLATGMTGIAMISGEPEFEDIRPWYRTHFLYPSYPLPSKPERPHYEDWNVLKEKALNWGFEELIVVGGESDCCTVEKISLKSSILPTFATEGSSVQGHSFNR
jgi:hypothetical protein